MAEEDRSEQRPPEGSIFGKLPDSRPGTRSPRRRTAAEQTKTTAAKAAKRPAAKAKAAATKSATRRPSPVSVKPETAAKVEPSHPPREAAAEPEGGRQIEDLAWAGVAVAAEAATVGVRLASKAIEALRGSQERR